MDADLAPGDGTDDGGSRPTSPALMAALLALFGTTLGLAAFEGAVYAWLPLAKWRQYQAKVMDVWQFRPARSQHDPVLGFRTRANLAVSFSSPCPTGFSTRVRTNSRGLRDDEASLADPAVLFLGDSFTFGWGVEDDETFEARFQAATGRSSLNLGEPGYGTAQALLMLRDHLGDRRLDGRTVVHTVYLNDLEENLGFGFGVYPRLVEPDTPAAGFTRSTPEAHARWLRAVAAARFDRSIYRRSYAGFLAGRVLDKLGRMAGIFTPPPPAAPRPPLEVQLGLFRSLLGALEDEVRGRGGCLRVVHIAGLRQEVPGVREQVGGMLAAIEDAGIPCLETAPLLGPEDYFPADGHWRPSAHAKAAQALATWLPPPGCES